MNKLRMLVGSALLALLLTLSSGCAGMNDTEKGFLGGGVIGAGVGALVGLACHNPAAGAAIGGVVGAAGGGVAGAVADNEKARGYAQGVREQQAIQANQVAAQVSARQMGVGEVIALAQQHVSDDLIIQQIRSTGSNFNLNSNDILALKQNGVSDNVVREMQTVHAVAGPYVAQPVVAPGYRETVIVEEPRVIVRPYGYYGYGYYRRW